tara:strand:+ start:295 stop:528 length:234 start_codon:yes stop_codon:yes gene_type:complete
MATKKTNANKYALLDASYKKLAVPVEFLPMLLENAFLVETEYTDGEYEPVGIQDLRKVEIVDGISIDNAIAQQKLRS